MTNQEAQGSNLRFDEARGFSENSRAFLARLKNVDADMALILRDNWDALVAVVREGERGSKAREEFNSKVASALDSLLKPAEAKDGE